MKKYLLTVIAALFSAVGFAQEGALIDVEGLCIDDKMNYEQFVAKFGKPDRTIGYGLGHFIDGNFFHFDEDDSFIGFSVKTNKFAVLTKNFPGGIRVGDKLSKLDNFKYGKPVRINYGFKPEEGYLKYALFSDTDFPIKLLVKDGIIKVIYFIYPV